MSNIGAIGNFNLAGHHEINDIVNFGMGAWQIVKKNEELSCFPGGAGKFNYTVKLIANRYFTQAEITFLKSMREKNLDLAA